MSQVIGQVWREVVGCRNWPVMRVPQFIAILKNGSQDVCMHIDVQAWVVHLIVYGIDTWGVNNYAK